MFYFESMIYLNSRLYEIAKIEYFQESLLQVLEIYQRTLTLYTQINN